MSFIPFTSIFCNGCKKVMVILMEFPIIDVVHSSLKVVADLVLSSIVIHEKKPKAAAATP